MISNILTIFKRDLKVNLRNFIPLYIIIAPVILAVGINIFTPGIADTTINLALLKNDSSEQINYYKTIANVELFSTEEDIIKRVNKRDHIIGILPDNDGNYYMLAQGNEPESVIEFSKLVKSLYDIDATLKDTNTTLVDFGYTTHPIKKLAVTVTLLMTSVLGGMLTTINIVEEKMDGTIKAINVSTVSRLEFILGKCVLGILIPILGSIVVVLMTGFNTINYFQLLSMIFSLSFISILIGFIEGLTSDDVMDAIASVKMLFIPIIGSIAIGELLSERWQFTMYWNPFYWAYKGINKVLSLQASWNEILLYDTFIIAICLIGMILLKKKIFSGLK